MGLVVYTAVIGDETDELRSPLVHDAKARYVCFSDQPVCVPPYEWVRVAATRNPRLASRAYKILGTHPALDGATMTLWHDASYQLTRDVRWVREMLKPRVDLVAFQHARRKRTLDIEARRLVQYGYLTRDEATAHLDRYRSAGFAYEGPVTCGGLLARRRSLRMAQFNQQWWAEVQLWGGRDQASLDYVAWSMGITMKHLDGQIKANAYAQWREVAIPA